MASDKLDMSLEDIIKLNRTSGGGGRRGGGGGRGGFRGRGGRGGRGGGVREGFGQRKEFGGVARGGVRGRRAPAPYTRPTQMPDQWKHDLFEGGAPSRPAFASPPAAQKSRDASDGTLLISNLDFGVNDSDINELFGEFGFLKKAAVHYDRYCIVRYSTEFSDGMVDFVM